LAEAHLQDRRLTALTERERPQVLEGEPAVPEREASPGAVDDRRVPVDGSRRRRDRQPEAVGQHLDPGVALRREARDDDGEPAPDAATPDRIASGPPVGSAGDDDHLRAP
jgi:hypothetical protein